MTFSVSPFLARKHCVVERAGCGVCQLEEEPGVAPNYANYM